MLTRTGTDVNGHISTLLRKLVSVQSRVEDDAKKASLTALIELSKRAAGFVSLTGVRSDRSSKRPGRNWQTQTGLKRPTARVRVTASPAINVTSEAIRSRIPLEEARGKKSKNR